MSFKGKRKPIQIRNVWSHNLVSEVSHLSHLIDSYPFVSMDTEFPGNIYESSTDSFRHRSPDENYNLLKSNVDALKLIQLGLTLSDSAGNLPDLGTEFTYVWQFNFSDFDLATDLHKASSIELLRNHGIDFEENRAYGVDSARFAEEIMSSGLVLNEDVTWVAFQSAYDFAYVLKVLTHRALPSGLGEFMELHRVFFGRNVFDLRYLMEFCNSLYGGLEKVAGILGVYREAGNSHQAGSDSLLTWHVFLKMRAWFFPNGEHEKHAGVVYGLNVA